MFCQNCGTELPATAQFCLACGDPQTERKLADEKPTSGRTREASIKPVIIVITLALVGFAVYAMVQIQNRQNTTNASFNNTGQSSIPIPVPTNHNTTLVADNLVLPQGYVKWINFHVQGTGTVTGRFEAHGGIDDAIRVLVTDQDGLTNYRKRNAFRAWYNSQDVAVDNINTKIGPGDYVLVISNTGSLTNRTIQIVAQLADYY